MKISTILDHIDSGHMALPEFQRGYVWNRDQVRGLFDSLYRRHPVGGLLVWATESETATHRGEGPLAAGVVKLLLDGQQRMTSLYGVVHGKPPKFFDGNAQAFTGLCFHLENETFAFYQRLKMKDDPLWIDVTVLMSQGQQGHEQLVEKLAENPALGTKAVKYSGRISRILGILEVDLHVEEVTGADKTLDVVVDIFNKVNSGGTKLSKGDLALAQFAGVVLGECGTSSNEKDTGRQACCNHPEHRRFLIQSGSPIPASMQRGQHLNFDGAIALWRRSRTANALDVRPCRIHRFPEFFIGMQLGDRSRPDQPSGHDVAIPMRVADVAALAEGASSG